MHEASAGMLIREAREATELRARLDAIRLRHPASDPRMVADVVCAVLTTMRGDLTAHETGLLAEVEELGRVIAAAKAEIAALRVDDINMSHIPSATDELDAIVAHTATATESILETCETLDQVADALARPETCAAARAAAHQLQGATTRIYEACGFQDITGQRITKVVATLKTIESRIDDMVTAFGAGGVGGAGGAGGGRPAKMPPVDPGRELLNGPQLPTVAMDQGDIDKLLASFD